MATLLLDNQDTNYESTRLVELRALAREHELQGHSRLRKAGLIALLQENEPMPIPMPASWVRPRLPRSTRSPPPYPRFLPYELEQAFRRSYQSFQINGRSRLDVETFPWETRGSVSNLMTTELRDLDAMKAQMITWFQFKVEGEDGDQNIITVNMDDKALNSQMMKCFREVT